MDGLAEFFTGIDDIRFSKGGSFVDRLHYKYTPMLLGLSSVIMLALQFGGEYSISCWCPAQFTDSMVEYTNQRCWTSRTYHVPMTSPDIPRDESDKEYISYYQYVPAVLFLQCFLFFVPSQIWRSLSASTGFAVSRIVDKAYKLDQADSEEEKDEIVEDVYRRMKAAQGKDTSGKWKEIRSKLRRNSLPFSYLLIKCIYIVNLVWQMKFVNWYLGGDPMRTYVSEVLKKVLSTGVWPESTRFPTVTLCDFPMRVHHHIQDHTVQCALPLNFYHEKLFAITWLWFAILMIITLWDTLAWVIWTIRVIFKSATWKNPPIETAKGDNVKAVKIYQFLYQEFRVNGLFLKRMLSKNVGQFAANALLLGVRNKFNDFQADSGDCHGSDKGLDQPDGKKRYEHSSRESLHSMGGSMKKSRVETSKDKVHSSENHEEPLLSSDIPPGYNSR